MLFPKWTNRIPILLAIAGGGGALLTLFIFWYWFSPKHLEVGYMPKQPIAYSHKIHVGQLGMDCRYCHFQAEESQFAGVPPTSVCMQCHSVIKKESEEIKKLTRFHQEGKPVPWIRIHKLPDYAYFDHSAHVNKGVSCNTCHGRIDQMDEVRQTQPLSMSWCLDCHKEPWKYVQDKKNMTKMQQPSLSANGILDFAEGKEMVAKYKIHTRTDCSTCHR